MNYTTDYFKRYEQAYNYLRQFQQDLKEEKAMIELKVTENEQSLPQIQLKLTNIIPSISSGNICFKNTENTDILLKQIMADYIDHCFETEPISFNNINGNFPGYIDTKDQPYKARLTLGILKDYHKYEQILVNIFAQHNSKVSAEKESIKVFKLI